MGLFYPTRFKIIATFVLVGYLLVSLIYFALFGMGKLLQAKQSPYINTLETLGFFVAAPAVFLSMPVIYVSSNIFTTPTTLNEMMRKDGCTNCTDSQFDQPLKQQTSIGFAAGVIVEIACLYVLACLISAAMDSWKKRKAQA